MGFNVKTLASLATALVSGGSNPLEHILLEKLEAMGEEAIREIISQSLSDFDLLGRTKAAFETKGMSEINNLRARWLNPGGGAIGSFASRTKTAYTTGGKSEFNRLRRRILGSDGSEAAKRIQEAFFGKFKERDTTYSRDEGGRTWSSSRREWLDAGWRHDWRSQPRDKHGKWIPGRLKHPYMTKGARKIRSKRRAAARKAAKSAYLED